MFARCQETASQMLAPRQSRSLCRFFTQDVHPEHESGSSIGNPQLVNNFALGPSTFKMIPESTRLTRIKLVEPAATIRAFWEHAGGPWSNTLKNVAAHSHVFSTFRATFF